MCWNCNNKEKNLVKEKLFNKLKGLTSQNSCSCQNCPCNEQQKYEECQGGSCQDDHEDDDVNEHLDALSELLDNSKTAVSQIQDMVEEIEESLEDIKEAIGQTEEDLEDAEEIIDNLR